MNDYYHYSINLLPVQFLRADTAFKNRNLTNMKVEDFHYIISLLYLSKHKLR